MYYIYEENIAFAESETSGVTAYAYPKNERAANEMMTNAKSRYSYVRSMPKPEGEVLKKHSNSLAVKYAQGIPEDFSIIESLPVPSIYFVLGPSANRFKVTKEKFDKFISNIEEYKKVQQKRRDELTNMTYRDIIEYVISSPLNNVKKDQMMTAISNMGSSSVGPDIETNLTNRQALETAYFLLRGYEESKDESVIDDIILLGNGNSSVDYRQAENQDG